MGGRGASSKISWKAQLKQMQKRGVVPTFIAGSADSQRQVFLEIDKLYSVPNVKTLSIVDQGDGVYVNFGGSVSKAGYPSKANASDAEKRGVLKWLLWLHK